MNNGQQQKTSVDRDNDEDADMVAAFADMDDQHDNDLSESSEKITLIPYSETHSIQSIEDDNADGDAEDERDMVFIEETANSTDSSGEQENIPPAVYIGGLEWWTTEHQIETLFAEFGKFKTLKIFENELNGKSKGYAFAEFQSTEVAIAAKEKLANK
eukprot:gene8928-10466_t